MAPSLLVLIFTEEQRFLIKANFPLLVKTKQEWRNWRQDATVASCWVPLRHAGPAVRCVPLNVHDPNLIPGQQSLAKNAPDPFDRCMIDFDFALLPQAMSICLAISVKYLRLMYIPRIWENPIWKTAFRNSMYLAMVGLTQLYPTDSTEIQWFAWCSKASFTKVGSKSMRCRIG